jgi:hypothetical protein
MTYDPEYGKYPGARIGEISQVKVSALSGEARPPAAAMNIDGDRNPYAAN